MQQKINEFIGEAITLPLNYTQYHGITNFCGTPVYQIKWFDIVNPKLTKLANGTRHVAATMLTNQFRATPFHFIVDDGIMGYGTTKQIAAEHLSESFYVLLSLEERISRFCRKFEMGKKYPATEFLDWHHRLTGSCESARVEWQERSIYANQDVTVLQFFSIARTLYHKYEFKKVEMAFLEYHTITNTKEKV